MIINISCVKFSSWGAYQAAKRIASNWTGFQRGAKAAKSLARQRQLLAHMRSCLKAGATERAQTYYAEWKRERAIYLTLVGYWQVGEA